MTLEGEIAGAIKRWDTDDVLPEDDIEEFAGMCANMIRYEFERYSIEMQDELRDGEG